ncbi:hypothetical protein CR513_16604, partial [Mucuna pruriens]
MENHLAELTSLVRQLVVGQQQPTMAAKICGICTFVEHPTDITGSSRIRIGHLITSNREDSHFGQDRIKGLMQPNNSDPHRTPIRGKQVINNRLRNTQHHLSNNNKAAESTYSR